MVQHSGRQCLHCPRQPSLEQLILVPFVCEGEVVASPNRFTRRISNFPGRLLGEARLTKVISQIPSAVVISGVARLGSRVCGDGDALGLLLFGQGGGCQEEGGEWDETHVDNRLRVDRFWGRRGQDRSCLFGVKEDGRVESSPASRESPPFLYFSHAP